MTVERNQNRVSHRRRRAASAVIEFAFVTPVLLLLLYGLFEFGWAFYEQGVVNRAVRTGCRVGALVDAGDDPSASATVAMEQYLRGAGLDCGPGGCESTVRVTGESPDRVLNCSLAKPFVSLTGAMPFMDGVSLHAATRLRVEWRE